MKDSHTDPEEYGRDQSENNLATSEQELKTFQGNFVTVVSYSVVAISFFLPVDQFLALQRQNGPLY